MSDEMHGKPASDKRPFSKFYRDIYESLREDKECLLVYTILLNESTWGECKKRKRRVHDLAPGQVLTSFRDLQKITGMHYADVQNTVNTLADMGLISTELFPRVGICVTIRNQCLKNIQSAIENLKKVNLWKLSNNKRAASKLVCDSPASHVKDKRVTRRRVTKINECFASESLKTNEWLAGESLTPSPSSFLEEEGFNKNNKERNENPSPSEPYISDDLDFGNWDLGEEQPHTSLDNVKSLPPTKDFQDAEEWLKLIREAYPRAKCEPLDLIKIIEEGKKIVEEAEMPPNEFIAVVSYVWHKGNDYQKGRFFKTPKDILKQDDFGTTILEEMCLSYKTFFIKAEAKMRRKY